MRRIKSKYRGKRRATSQSALEVQGHLLDCEINRASSIRAQMRHPAMVQMLATFGISPEDMEQQADQDIARLREIKENFHGN